VNNHPEKLRDWPCDVSATYFMCGANSREMERLYIFKYQSILSKGYGFFIYLFIYRKV
jgi:hypothetical protein